MRDAEVVSGRVLAGVRAIAEGVCDDRLECLATGR